MAEKAIRLGGESTAAAVTQTVDGLYPEHKFNEADFTLKHNDDEIAVDSNFAAQSFWKDARIRFFRKKSAVLGLILIVFIVVLAIFGPGMNSYTYSGQDLSQKNFAPRVPGIESFGILDGSEKMSTTTADQAKMGYVGAFTYAEVISGYTSFFLGARSVCPSVTMDVTFTGSWYDETAI